ncbi:hypothetical protein GCM10010974_36800 [Brevibacterium sediminis]|uniref:Uncharacterized protein n=1 Tax=Brevibacterium sediminis TaxID=1857024 RepID=A0ABQ1N8X3_9MICO|nr:hypothetical protein GCM10010974_36800 [Brevibacterium sediminis]
MKIDAVVRVFVGDDNRIDLSIRHMAQQAWERAIAEIEHKSEPIPVKEIAAAGLPRDGVGGRGSEDRECTHHISLSRLPRTVHILRHKGSGPIAPLTPL